MWFLNRVFFLALVGSQASSLALFYPPKGREASKLSSVSHGPQEESTLIERGEINPPVALDSESLILTGDSTTMSNSLPVACEERLCNFFRASSFRNLLVSGGGERLVQEVALTDVLLQDWSEKCKLLGAVAPSQDDCILSVESQGIEFPGLKVKSIATVGVKYVEEDKASPRHEFVLLRTKEEAKGLPPVVWTYNKLTGANDSSRKGNEVSRVKSLSTVSYRINNGNVVFQTKAFLQIGITFPKVLLKILPGDKARIEEKASSSVQKSLEKDLIQSMKAYESAYSNEMKL